MDQVKKRPNNFKRTGAAANPAGRPKAEFSWSGVLKEIANRTDLKSGKDFKTAVGEVLFREALKGNIQAIRELGNRWEGMPIQKAEIGGGDKPILFKIVKDIPLLEDEEEDGDTTSDSTL